jgi:beta-glucosidase
VTMHRFPEGFLWGVATSALQIEGGRNEGGRGESVWDRYAEKPGAIEDGSNPSVACDHYHRWREDVGLMEWLGVGAYRFSIGWPRVLPEGTGSPNLTGLEFYDRLVDGLIASGIQPFVTLNHWDMPQALMENGGWASRDAVQAFVDYAAAVTERLGDRVRYWVTHNEPWCIATLGYEEAHHAPGLTDPGAALSTAHHLLLSHGRALEVIRENSSESEAGIVLNLCPAQAATGSDADRDAARQFDGLFNRWYLDPLFRGEYPGDTIQDRVRKGHLESNVLPFVHAGDMATIRAPMDFLGVNYYSRAVVEAGPDGNVVGVDVVPEEELTEMRWEVYPQGLTDVLLRVHREYRPESIFITESGVAFPDVVGENGRVSDPRRVEFLGRHMAAAHRALEEGVPLRGYFVWSLLDNFEWQHGYTKRFGLFRVDYETCRRTQKKSADWFRETIARNAVEDESPLTP